ncbi:MAG: beta-ketoacyl-[acyl-carrier-protein] synthase family protein [Rhodobacteraceae bacterium]|nr:beta-ketoacyl-[acyl-carrier-protein] synthase family protein [Paracoccaceae bacterium]
MRRVVITGQGTVNPLGKSVQETYDAMAKGQCAITQLQIRDVERLSVRVGAQVQDYQAERHFSRQELVRLDRFSQFALLSARQAAEQAGLEAGSFCKESAGVVIGTAGGGLNTWDSSYRAVYQERKNRVHPFVVPRLMNNAAASTISMQLQLQGPTFSVSTACSSSNHAIGQAFHMIRGGAAELMFAGGSESMICFGGIKAWESLRVMSSTGCRPFSADRDGMVQGEGAAVFLLEEYSHATARGAQPLCEILGFCMTSDAGDIVLPSREGAARTMRGALADAGIDAAEIDYVNAHGTATAANDRIECAAIHDVFDSCVEELRVSSTKSMHGHLIGGTGAVELLACTLALTQGVIAPTIGIKKQDPNCRLDVVPNKAVHSRVDFAMSNAFAFGGLNAVLVLGASR